MAVVFELGLRLALRVLLFLTLVLSSSGTMCAAASPARARPCRQDPQDPTPPPETDADVAERLYRERFVSAIRRAHAPLADWDLCLHDLDRAALVIPELAVAKRAPARLGIAVRKAEVHALAGRDAEASKLLVQGREAAVADGGGSWSGSLRELANTLLWQVDPQAFAAVWQVEREFLEDAEAEGAAALRDPDLSPVARSRAWSRFVPMHVLHTSRDLHDPVHARRAERELLELADRLEVDDPKGLVERLRPWRDKALALLAWHAMFQRDFGRAELYLQRLPAGLGRYPLALAALRRGDAQVALQRGYELLDADVRFEYQHLIGHALEELGRLDAAAEAYRNARALAAMPLDVALAERGLGDVAWRRFCADGLAASLDEAARAYTAGITACRSPLGVPGDAASLSLRAERAQLLAAYGRVQEAQGESLAAWMRFRESLDLSGRLRDRFASSLESRGSVLRIEDVDAVEGLLRTHVAAGQQVSSTWAAIESRRARTLLDGIARAPGTDELDRQAVLGAGQDTLAFATVVHDLVVVGDRGRGVDACLEAFERARLASRREVQARGHVLDSKSLETFATRAAERAELVLLYWRGREAVWLGWNDLGAGGALRMTRLGGLAEADRVRDAAVAAVASARAPYRRALTEAAAWFLPEVVRRSLARAERVVLCPGPVLSAMPFEAFALGAADDQASRLGVAKIVERCPSLTVRSRLAERARRVAAQGDAEGSRQVGVVHSVQADPELERLFGLDPLAHSAGEASLVREAHGAVRELSYGAATLPGLRAFLLETRHDIVHLSAHAIMDPRVPTASLLALADGPASVLSLVDLPLAGALLVLSACSSASGERRAAEGELGLLAWPFWAGARGAVAALWPVNQQATMDLMGQFHFELAAGVETAEAMRRARAILAASPNYEHPFFWAGFAVFVPPAEGVESELPWGLVWGSAAGMLILAAAATRVRRRRSRSVPG